MDFSLYHLNANPFIAYSSDRLWSHAAHQLTLDRLRERIDTRRGVIGLLGQPGLGKTTLLQSYCASVDPQNVHVMDGIDGTQSNDGLLTSLARACGLNRLSLAPAERLSMLSHHCRAMHARGRRLVLFMDDAHTLSVAALANLQKLFERLHHDGKPLLQIVLCGNPSLQQRCQHPDLYYFGRAMPAALQLSPLSEDDSAAYIHHYLRSASTQATPIFTKPALKLITSYCQGIPKVINITCSDILVAGLLAGEKPISTTTVRSVIGDDTVRISPGMRWGLISVAGLLLVVGLWQMLPIISQPALRVAAPIISQTPPPSSTLDVAQAAQEASTEPNTPDKQPIAKQLASDNTFREPQKRAKVTEATREPGTTHRDHMKDPVLISSTRARLLCAMPRTGGKRGSDIVLLDHAPPGVHRLIDDGSQNMSPVLSPDGTQLAYTSYRGGAPNIYLRALASGQDTQITSGPWLALPGTWSPNGRYLSFSQSIKGNHDIFIYDMTQKRAQRLTRHQSIDVSPSFAPDSQRLVFSSDRTGSPQLYITDISGTTPVRLTQTGSYNTSPSWSPRDDIIAFVGRGESQALDLYTIKSDGTQRRRLTQGQRFHTPPAWLPDGQMFMGMRLRGAAWEPHLVPLAPDRAIPKLPQPKSLCLAPQWVAYRAP